MRQLSDETRVRMCIKEIKDMDSEITIETMKFSFLALSVGISFLAVIYFGGQVLEIISENDFSSFLNFELSEIFTMVQLIISGEINLISYVLAREKVGVLKACIEYKKYYQRELDEICIKDRTTVRKRARVRYEDKI